MLEIVIDQNLCCGSSRCVDICPEKAITLVNGKAVIDLKMCDLDGICIPACPQGAISFHEGYVGGCGF